MKKALLQIAIVFLIISSSFAQDVPEIQRPLITKIAATWCPPCGGWGWTFFEDLVVDNEDQATLIVAHHDGDLVTVAGDAFSSNFNSPYQPYFYVYNDDVEASSSTASAKRIEIKDLVDVEAAKSPIANTGMILNLADLQLQILTKTKFFQSASGEYYLGIYAVENEVVNFQQGQGANAVHEKILRGSLLDDTFGELISSGDVDAGSEIEKNYNVELDANWDVDHLEIVTIIWKKEGDTYVATNTNLSTDFVPLVGNENVLLKNASLEVLPNVISNQAIIKIELEKELKNTTVELIDLDGKTVSNIFQGNLPLGNSNFNIERNLVSAKGMYFVVLKSNQKVITKKVIFN